MARRLYSLLLLVLAPILLSYLYFIRGRKNPGYRTHFTERLGFNPNKLPQHAVVIHCASVGEVLAATPLIKSVLKEQAAAPIIVTCNTPTGREEITKAFHSNVQVHVCYLPIDFAFAVRKFFMTLKPKLLIVMETELWPNIFHYAKQNQCKTLVVNARLSEKSYQGYKKHAWLTKGLMSNIDLLAAHNEEDGERFIKLGLVQSKLHITGSIKFDISITEEEIAKARQFQANYPERLIWLAGSTHPKEHEQVIAAHQRVLKQVSNALLIIAPRHPEQFQAVADYLSEQEIAFTKKSSNGINAEASVLLADTLGELKWLFGGADIAYIGGSLIERGGHNPLEAAAHGVPILTGPHTYNFAHIYPQLIAQQGAIVVDDKDKLAAQIITLFEDKSLRTQIGANAQSVLVENTGAIAKTMKLINKSLE
ncbi:MULTISPECIES: lipid IV(A) 3-deoxy-D-manno-octulosonic acid transferase [Pseudoalteromonas]|uniref:3-deoxy-D-manno-octulosonic acid transferase n=1 Tax=Pseudoalteromonas maricaloris TaxID=184924 RepID=A0A8I2HBD2_9GAMM|nr:MULTISPECIES: lipid IV(A) 3-deoxy-D-manno-octulosonic acid transferase [Pseudoalteromonas]KID38959.1 3-deoxy-D-manno-octulosonic acid transferase [Pseudoalteromonas flavipulchra NCIMB 2033 = ATCC BAA-314]MBD0784398.1 3-deoxy-D-manno-octulosonic acid transferase [Pseudoalteromonas flavipulchra]MBE0374132.1 3-deoxy-D-manno-octulosonic-acid transferase [Pseudoalteromonas flavipulchra NCIMB 2033 = ATCC BAA-314]NLR22410.1 3-deoxy-D-manno-octulosonic acid transferase [Pseudoalteromonas maricaloris